MYIQSLRNLQRQVPRRRTPGISSTGTHRDMSPRAICGFCNKSLLCRGCQENRMRGMDILPWGDTEHGIAHSHQVFLVVRVPELGLQDLPVAVSASWRGISASRREPAFHKEIISYDSVMNLCACISLAAGASPSYVSVCHRPSVAQSKQRIPFSLRGGEPSFWHEASLGHGSFPKLAFWLNNAQERDFDFC